MVRPHKILDGVWLLRGAADSAVLQRDLEAVLALAPLRRMQTRRGFTMSVAMSNCGAVGWVSDRRGYRYSEMDPESGESWPPMPESFMSLASLAAGRVGFAKFQPDVCLINRYLPGCAMGAHQDVDERDFDAPIVSVSLGLPARFFVVGPERRGRSTAIDLVDGDVVVFGGPARRYYHGVRKLKPARDASAFDARFNLTFRKAL